MNEQDFETYLKLCNVEHQKNGLTDSEGYYTFKGNTKNRLIEVEIEVLKLTIDLMSDVLEEKEALENITKLIGRGSYEARKKMLDLFLSLKVS